MSNDLILCQRGIRRLRCVVRIYEAQMRELESYLEQMAGNSELGDEARQIVSEISNIWQQTLPLRERTYLWMSRHCGTWCLKERRVFLKPTSGYHIWTYYSDSRSVWIWAYAVEVTGLEGGKVIGNLYPLDYREHVEYRNVLYVLFKDCPCKHAV